MYRVHLFDLFFLIYVQWTLVCSSCESQKAHLKISIEISISIEKIWCWKKKIGFGYIHYLCFKHADDDGVDEDDDDDDDGG